MARQRKTKAQVSAARRAVALGRWQGLDPAARRLATAPATAASHKRFCADVQCDLPVDHTGQCQAGVTQ
jgi:hypothetical protein